MLLDGSVPTAVIDIVLTEDICAPSSTAQATYIFDEGGRGSITQKSRVACSRVFSVEVCKL